MGVVESNHRHVIQNFEHHTAHFICIYLCVRVCVCVCVCEREGGGEREMLGTKG